jgi:hypothetical protein
MKTVEQNYPKYQFQIDGRGFKSPLRDTWEAAAHDAVSAGYAVWVSPGEIRINEQAEIAEFR